MAPAPQLGQHPRHHQREHGIEGMEIAHGLEHQGPAVAERQRGPCQRQGERVTAAAPQRHHGRADADEGGQAECRSHAPSDDLLQRKQVGRSTGPLDARRPVVGPGLNRVLLVHGAQKRLAQPPVQRGSRGKGVRLRDPKRDRRGDANQGASSQPRQCHGYARPQMPAAPAPHPPPDGHQDQQQPGAQLARQRQPDGQPKQAQVQPARLVGRAYQQPQRGGAEEGRKRVDGEEVRELDGMHRQRHQQGCQQPRPRAQQVPSQQIDQHHRAGVGDSRHGAAHQIGLVVALHVQQAAQPIDQKDGQRAVDEEVDALVERAVRRRGGIEIHRQIGRRADLGEHDAEEALIGVEVAPLIPVQAKQPHGERQAGHRRQREPMQRARVGHPVRSRRKDTSPVVITRRVPSPSAKCRLPSDGRAATRP